MAHTIYMGTFNKRLNSTKQPTYTGWTSYNCVFKDETSLYRPTVRIAGDFATFAGSNYNYAVMLNKYYYIQDVRSIRAGYIEVDMAIDPLATYKSSITGTSAFIEYGFNTFDASDSTNRFPDKRLAVSETPVFSITQTDITGGLISPLSGCYVIQAVGNNTNGAHKGLATFVLTAAQLAGVMASINSTLTNSIDAFFSNPSLSAQDIMNEMTRLSLKTELLNESAMAAIQSVKWLPLDISGAHGTANTALYLGNYSTGVNAIMLDENSTYSNLSTMDIPWPTGIDDWRRNNCQLLLYLPFIGTVPIPIDQSIGTSSLGITWTTEYFSGSVSVIVKTGDGAYIVYTGSTNIAVDMGIGRSSVGISGLMGGTIQALGGALEMAGGIADAGASAVGSLLGVSSFADAARSVSGGAANVYGGYAQTVQPVISCAGTMGGMAAIAQTTLPTLTCIFYPPIDMDNFQARYGHPVMAMGTPVSGFCKARGFSVGLNAPGYICAAINDIVNGGVFIE